MGMAQRLRADFQGLDDVLIAADQRTGQILVLAPLGVQAQVQQRIGYPSVAQTLSGPKHPLPLQPVRSQIDVARPIELRYTSMQQMADSLQSTLDKRLQPVAGVAGTSQRYRVRLAGDTMADVILDSQTGQVTVQGPPAAVDACIRLVQALDAALAGGPQRTQAIPFKNAKPASVQRAVEALQTGRISSDGRLAPNAADPSSAAGRCGHAGPDAAEKQCRTSGGRHR